MRRLQGLGAAATVPVIDLGRGSRHASIVLPSGSDGLPSLALTATGGRSRRIAGLRELSTSGVHSTYVAIRLVGSCPTFSPLPPVFSKPDIYYETIFK